MSGIVVPFKINDREFLVSPYTSAQEKDLLILLSFDVEGLSGYLRILGLDDPDSLSDNVKKALLWKFREVSLGDEVMISFSCSCGNRNECSVKASTFIETTNVDESLVKKFGLKKLDKPVNDDTLHEFCNMSIPELEELDIKEYVDLVQVVKDYQTKFNFERRSRCMSCKKEHIFDLGSDESVLKFLSDETLASIYRVYADLVYFGKYTKQDIDTMYPFERTIFVGLLHKIKTDERG